MDINGAAALCRHRYGRWVIRPTSPALRATRRGQVVVATRRVHDVAAEISGSLTAVKAVRKPRVVAGIGWLAFFGGQPPIDALGVHRCPIILLGVCKVLIFCKVLTFKV